MINKKFISLVLVFLMLVTIIPLNSVKAEDNNFASNPELANDNEIVKFNDARLEEYIYKLVKPADAAYSSENINVGEMRQITTLKLSLADFPSAETSISPDKKPLDLTGLEFAVNIETLETEIGTVNNDVIKHFENLKSISVSNNIIGDRDYRTAFENNFENFDEVNKFFLVCCGEPLFDVSILNELKNLTDVKFENSGVLVNNGLSKLTNNNIRDLTIDRDCGETLDIRNLNNLGFLSLYGNFIRTVKWNGIPEHGAAFDRNELGDILYNDNYTKQQNSNTQYPARISMAEMNITLTPKSKTFDLPDYLNESTKSDIKKLFDIESWIKLIDSQGYENPNIEDLIKFGVYYNAKDDKFHCMSDEEKIDFYKRAFNETDVNKIKMNLEQLEEDNELDYPSSVSRYPMAMSNYGLKKFHFLDASNNDFNGEELFSDNNFWLDYYFAITFDDIKDDVIPAEPDGSRPEGTPESYVKITVNLNKDGEAENQKIYYVTPDKEVYIPIMEEVNTPFKGSLIFPEIFTKSLDYFPVFFDKDLKNTFREDTEINMLYGKVKPIKARVGDIIKHMDVVNSVELPPELNKYRDTFYDTEDQQMFSGNMYLVPIQENNFPESDYYVKSTQDEKGNNAITVAKIPNSYYANISEDDVRIVKDGVFYILGSSSQINIQNLDKQLSVYYPICFATTDKDIMPEKEDGLKPINVPDYYKLVEFKADNTVTLISKKDGEGKDFGNRFWVNPKVEVDLTDFAPDVEAEKAHSFEGWDKSLKGTFTENTVINAKISDIPFDKNNVVGMEIVSEPNKMSYTDGEELNLAGLKVKLIDKNDVEQIVDLESFGDYNITVEPTDKTALTLKDNDKVITVKKAGLDDVATKGKLSVTEKVTEDNRKDNEKYPAVKPNKTEVVNKDKLTKEEKDKVAEEVKKVNPKAKDIAVKDNGDTVITYPDGSTNELKQVDTVVQKKIEDKRKDNEKYPAQKPIRTAVKDKSDLTYREKDRVTERIKDANPHVLTIYVKDNGDAILTYPDGSTNELSQRDTVYELGESRKPEVDKVYEGDEYITGKGEPYAAIDIKLPNDKIITGSTDRYGYFKIKVPVELKEDDIIYVTQTEFESEESDRVKVTVLKNDKVDKKLKTEQHYAYIVGYPDGRFGPNDIITRAQAAMIFARLSRNQDAAPASYFSDVNSTDWYAKAVGIGIQEGFIKGYIDGTFKPNQPMTRAEFASVISAFAEKETKRSSYKDVDGWAAGVIDTAYVNGWMQGDGRGYFRPNDYISRAEAVSVVNRMLKRKPDKEFIDKHLLTSSTLFARPFSDVDMNSWYFYDVYAAAFGHDYKIKDKVEKWTELNGKVFTVR